MRQTYTRALVSRAREMRKNMTAPEKKLWLHLKTLPYKVRSQTPVEGYIVDFYIHALRLVIEVDGDSHFTPEAVVYDTERSQLLQGLGLQVLRFTNAEVVQNFSGVCESLEAVIAAQNSEKHRLKQ